MASEVGRGAQVRLDDLARRLARGGNTLRLLDNIVAKAAGEVAGTAPSGNTPDGSLGNGTAADDEVLLPGGIINATSISVRDFGAVGNGVADDTLAIQRALDTGSTVRLPQGEYVVTSPLVLSTSGQQLIGDGAWRSIIRWAGGSVDAVRLVDDQNMRVCDLMIIPKTGQPALTAGYAISISRTVAAPFMASVERCIIYGMFNGILASPVTEGLVRDVLFWALTGTRGILYTGSAAASSFSLTLDTVRFGGMDSNPGCILVDQNSYANSLRMDKCVLVGGGIGFRMGDSAATGTSYPLWCIGSGNECDHPQTAGVSLEGGEGFNWSTSWLGSCLAGSGLRTQGTWRGEATLSGTRVAGNIQHGISLGAGVDTLIVGCQIGDNSGGGAGTYHGINVAAGVSRFAITGNRIGDIVAVVGNAQGYGVRVAAGASDYYEISGNLLSGNLTGDVSDGGTGINKLVQRQTGAFDKLQFGDALHYAALSAGDPLVSVDAGDFYSYSRAGNAYGWAIGGVSVAQFRATGPVFPTLPTAATGLPSGALWRDAADGNTVKAVP